jgi:CGNR zinc finger
VSRVGPRDPGTTSLRPRRSLADLLWVANTRHGPAGHWFARVPEDEPDHDHLTDGPPAVAYLADHGVDVPSDPVTAGQLRSLVAIREMVRGLLDPAAGWTPVAERLLATTRFQVGPDGGLAAERDGWDAFVGDLMIPLLEVVRIRDQLKVCGNPYCRLVFLDASKNRARRWCDNAGCGNRNRVRRYRARSTKRPVGVSEPG